MSDVTTFGNFTDASLVITDDSGLSATLAFHTGEFSIDNLVPDGAEAVVYQNQGHATGLRNEARVFPTLSVSGHLTTPLDAFRSLLLGLTAGFVSTTADIGNVKSVDGVLTVTYGTSVRRYRLDDMRATSHGHTGGSPSGYAISLESIGRVTLTDQTGATKVLIASR